MAGDHVRRANGDDNHLTRLNQYRLLPGGAGITLARNYDRKGDQMYGDREVQWK